jgi:excisionase family DNA binding protein
MTDSMTPRQVADELGVTVRTVQRWIADGRLPATRVGARVRVSRSSLASIAEAPAPPSSRLSSVLIANRGEIATRIARTARRLGLRTIGIHEPGERPPHGIDEAHEVPAYLDADAIVAVATRTSATALHPGYGFLAENAGFATAVEAAGVRWIGPPAAAIAAMGDKAAGRVLAAEHGVPTVPGYDGAAQDDAALLAAADGIGYPILVKPSAGGGGKGMRVVREAAELPEALAAGRREANRSFGDDRLILERYLVGSRHVEIQVLFDAHGAGIDLGERDCSAQRRSQKIVEEAPAPAMTPELRRRMGDAALAAARAAGYRSAGTVEMLLTDSGEFFFLEMNTRLQVEHPVTEAVTGRDIVEDQLRIAEGASLREIGLGEPPAIRGHAIEARIYAEEPEAGFLPATGRLALVRWPDGVRVDTGVAPGDEVTDRYDPMLAKLIVHAQTRAEAVERLREALEATTILGVRTNVRFLRWLVDRPELRDGEVRTDTIGGLDLPGPPVPGDEHWRAAAAALRPDDGSPWSGGWRLNGAAVVRIRHGDEARSVPAASAPAGVTAVADRHRVEVDVQGQSVGFALAPPPTVEEAVRRAATASGDGAALLRAPMPGRVIAVRASVGGAIRAREAVVVIEAMKMEHAVVAPADGTVVALHVAEGDQVERGAIVAEVGPAG